MNTAATYAKALREVSQENGNAKAIIANLHDALERRGHLKLLPAIVSEYHKLELAEKRSKARSTVTPESERNRTLLELYRKLVATN